MTRSPVKCPCCDGMGKRCRPPWVGGDMDSWMGADAGTLYDCHACKGTGVIWDAMEAANQPVERPRLKENEVAALFLGRDAARNLPVVIVAITAHYNIAGQGPSYHYQNWNALTGQEGEIKTIGSVAFSDFDPTASPDPPRFVMGCFKGLTWKRLR